MASSTKSTLLRRPGKVTKPPKPRSDFPLFAHASGQWAKKIRGRMRYFGAWAYPDVAEGLYILQRADYEAGREPSPYHHTEGLTIADAANMFLDAKHSLMKSGDVGQRQFDDLKKTCEGLVKHWGRQRAVESLKPGDFGVLRTKLAKGHGKRQPRAETKLENER